MRYIDSGTRDPSQALGTWLTDQLKPDVTELRWQSGFFSFDGLPLFKPTLERLKTSDGTTHVVIGSNDGDTLEAHVAQLVEIVGVPRSNGKLGVVSYSGAYFHPKTYHLRRADGSQAAYVGSANLSLSGIGALHIEAGIILDSRTGDSVGVLDEIAAAVDAWFETPRPGFELVADALGVTHLTASGILSLSRPPRTQNPTSGNSSGNARPRLQPLIKFPASGTGKTSAPSSPAVAAPPLASSLLRAAVPQPPFPPYVLFDPGASSPTSGAAALTGATLPGGHVGLVIRLNRDSARHWRGGSGTANISVPVPTVSTLRFGLFKGKYTRPRAEFDLEMRYLTSASEMRASLASTNVMVYGFSPGESGHGDVRMVVPAAPAREILDFVNQEGLTPPTDGDVALLEWPNDHQNNFRLSLIDPTSPLYQTATDMLTLAGSANQLVGQGACWLPPGVSPAW